MAAQPTGFMGNGKSMKRLAFADRRRPPRWPCGVQQGQPGRSPERGAEPAQAELNELANQAAMDAANAEAAALGAAERAQRRRMPRRQDNTVNPSRGRRAKRQRHVSRERPMSDDAIPAATLILVRERRAAPPELLMVERAERHGVRGRRAGLSRRADRRGRPAARRRAWRRSGARSPRSAKRSKRPRSRSDCRRCPTPTLRARSRTQLVADRPFAELLARARPSARCRRADTLRALGAEVPRGAPLRYLVLRRALPGRRWQPRVIEGECAGAAGSPRRRCWSETRAARRG